MSSAMFVPSLRFPEFDGEWKVSNLFESGVQIIDGDRGRNYPSSKDFSASAFCLFLNAKNVTKVGFSFQETMFVSKEKDEALSKGRLTMYDIVLTTRGTIGNVAYFDTTTPYKQIRINSGMVLLRSVAKILHPDYLYKFLSTGSAKKNILRISFGSAQPQLTVKGIKTLRLAFPALSEQQKIADFLTAVDKRIEQLEEKKRLLTEYKKGVMQQIFSQQIRFKDDKVNGEAREDALGYNPPGEPLLPNGNSPSGNPYPDWEENELKQVSDVRDGTHDSPKYTNQGYPLVTSKNLMTDGALSLESAGLISSKDYEQVNKRSKVNVGDILFGMIGTIGNPVLVKQDGFAIKNIALIKEQKNLNNTYLIHYLSSSNIARQFHEKNTGGTQKFIALNTIRKLTILIPHNSEQQKIADFLTSIDNKIEQIGALLEQAKVFKKGLLQQMFV